MQQFLHRHILLPAFETLYHRRKTFAHLASLQKTQWQSGAKLKADQFHSLQKLIAYAYRHCSYYRDLWNSRLCTPDKLVSLSDFHQWPVTCRDDILQNRMRMRGSDPSFRLIAKATGGSSGVPLRFDLNTDSHDRRNAAAHRGYAWAGADLGQKMLYLWGAPIGPSARSRLKDALYHRLYRRKVVNSFHITDERIPEILAMHNRYRPDAVVAYTNPLYEFARALKERGLTPRPPRTIIVGAEKLYTFQRDLIREVFQAPVFETYGSREFMLMAAECDRHEGLHLTSEHLYIEILNDDWQPTPPGEEGNIVVTDLFNYGMPFIRYVNGDRGIAGWKTCSCGRGLPLMQPPRGRQLDILHLSDGRRVAGEFFPHLIKDYPTVRRFQVVQSAPDRIQMRVVTTPAWSAADRDAIIRAVQEVAGFSVHFELQEVDQIELTPSGKLRVVVNECAVSSPHSSVPAKI